MTSKIAVSLPDDLVKDARQAVREGRAKSVSGYVADALRQAKREDSLKLLLEEWERDLGPIPHESLDWADEQLGLK